MLELLATYTFFVSPAYVPNRGIPAVEGRQNIYIKGMGIDLQKFNPMPCPLTLPERETVFDQKARLCFYIPQADYTRILGDTRD